MSKFYIVKNRSASRVCYQIPEDHIRRVFAPGEAKQISYDELLKLSYQPGGREIMVAFLQIQDAKVLSNLNINTQPEYYMSEQQIIDLLKNGSLDAFLDCLDFAPTGVIDLIKKYAISLPLGDYQKKEALKEKTGYDVDTILRNTAEDKDTSAAAKSSQPTAPAGRRTTPQYDAVAPATTAVQTPKYKVVDKK